MTRGIRRPADVKLASDRDGLAFYDGERAFASLRFGMAGQVTNEHRRAARGRARVRARHSARWRTTDSDGVFVLPNLVSAGKVADRRLHRALRREDAVVPRRPRRLQAQHRRRRSRHAPPPPPPPSNDKPVPPPPTADPPSTKAVGSRDRQRRVRIRRAARRESPLPRPARAACSWRRRSRSARCRRRRRVTGMMQRKFSHALTHRAAPVVNGSPTPCPLTNEEFTTTVTAAGGQEPADRWRCRRRCSSRSAAPILTLDDATPVIISTTHKMLHDTRADEIARYRQRRRVRPSGARHRARGRRARSPGLGFHRAGHRLRGHHRRRRRVPGQPAEGHARRIGGRRRRARRRTCSRGSAASWRCCAAIAAPNRSDASSAPARRRSIADWERAAAAATTVDALLARVLQVEGTARSLIAAPASRGWHTRPRRHRRARSARHASWPPPNSDGEIVVRGREYLATLDHGEGALVRPRRCRHSPPSPRAPLRRTSRRPGRCSRVGAAGRRRRRADDSTTTVNVSGGSQGASQTVPTGQRAVRHPRAAASRTPRTC